MPRSKTATGEAGVMNKSIGWVGSLGVALMMAAGAAQAQSCSCGGTGTLDQTALSQLVPGKTVCATLGNDSWQEFHQGSAGSLGGSLIDYKKGPGDAVDPTETVGSWSISGGTITHTYGGSSSYSYTVCKISDTQVTFCGNSAPISATLRPGQVSCGAAALTIRGR